MKGLQQNILTNDSDIAAEFAEHFRSSFVQDRTLIFESNRSNDITVFNDLNVTEDNLRRAIDTFDTEKSEGPTVIPNAIIKNCRSSFYRPFEKLLRKIKSTNTIPSELKKSRITPIIKANKPKQFISSHRAISVRSNVNKIIEKILLYNLENVEIINRITNPTQYGFVSGSSTETLLIELFHLITVGSDDRDIKTIRLVSFDYKDAFNLVPHNLVLKHLQDIGISGNLLELFKSYFNDRAQYVQFNNYKSTCIDATSGFPQGGLLSPNLFNLTVRTMGQSISHSSLFQFADDTLLAKALRHEQDNQELQQDVNSLKEYSDRNKSELHPLKTVVLDLSPRDTDRSIGGLTLNGTELEIDNECRHLGLFLDSRLNMKSHTSKVLKKAYVSYHMIRKIVGKV